MQLSDLNPKYLAQAEAQLRPSAAKLATAVTVPELQPAAPAKARLRQRTKPLLNRLETAFLARLEHQYQHGATILSQSVTLKIANGCRYTVDFMVITRREDYGIGIEAWEVKGPKSWEDGMIKLKVAAALYPWITFNLASGNAGTWRIQQILP